MPALFLWVTRPPATFPKPVCEERGLGAQCAHSGVLPPSVTLLFSTRVLLGQSGREKNPGGEGDEANTLAFCQINRQCFLQH